MKTALLGLASFLLLANLSAIEPDPSERAKWEAQIKQVHVGMRRAEVERLLPPYRAPNSDGTEFALLPYSGLTAGIQGGSQSIQYYVSTGWLVGIAYDYTGIPRDAAGTATKYESPDNRVLAPATLTYRIEIQRLAFDKKTLPPSIKYQGHIVDGAHWRDANGENVLVLTETGIPDREKNPDKDFLNAELYAYHYTINSGKTEMLWSLVDFEHDCDLDLDLRFMPKSLSITDLDADGIAESMLVYKQGCRGDISPLLMKLIMHEGKDKYAIRGTELLSRLPVSYRGGEINIDPSLIKAGGPFKDFAVKHWNKFAPQR